MKRPDRYGGIALTLLLALIIPILAACGSNPPAAAPPSSSAPTTAASVPAAATTGQAPTAAPAAVATSAPAAATQPNTGGATGSILRIAASLGTWPDTIAPQKASLANEIAVLLLNYEGLTRFDKDLKTVPAAAEKWEYNQNGTQITF